MLTRITPLLLLSFLTACGGGGSGDSSESSISYDARDYVKQGLSNTSLKGTWLLTSDVEYEVETDVEGVAFVAAGTQKTRATYNIVESNGEYKIYACGEAFSTNKASVAVSNNQLTFTDSYNDLVFVFNLDSNTQMTATNSSVLSNGDSELTILKNNITNAVKISDSSFADIGSIDIGLFNSNSSLPSGEQTLDLECVWQLNVAFTDPVALSSGQVPGNNYKHTLQIMEFVADEVGTNFNYILSNESIFEDKSSELVTNLGDNSQYFTFDNEVSSSAHRFNYRQNSFSFDASYVLNSNDNTRFTGKANYIWGN